MDERIRPFVKISEDYPAFPAEIKRADSARWRMRRRVRERKRRGAFENNVNACNLPT